MNRQYEALNAKDDDLVNIDHRLLFERAAKRREFFGLAKLRKGECTIKPCIDRTERFMHEFFTDGLSFRVDHLEDISNEKVKNNDPFAVTWRQLTMWPAVVRLLDDYLTDGTFKYPMCAVWNPSHKMFQINPGSTRLVVHALFGNETETFLTFNTAGKKIDWQLKFETFDDFVNYFPAYNSTGDNKIAILVYKNWGWYSPRVRFGLTRFDFPFMYKYYKKVQNFYNTSAITANFDLTSTGYSGPQDNVVRDVTVNVDVLDQYHILRAMLLLPLVSTYSDHGVTIATTLR